MAATPDLGRSLASNPVEMSGRINETLEEARLEEARLDDGVDLDLELAPEALIRLRPRDRRKEKGESVDGRELRLVERDDRFFSLLL